MWPSTKAFSDNCFGIIPEKHSFPPLPGKTAPLAAKELKADEPVLLQAVKLLQTNSSGCSGVSLDSSVSQSSVQVCLLNISDKAATVANNDPDLEQAFVDLYNATTCNTQKLLSVGNWMAYASGESKITDNANLESCYKDLSALDKFMKSWKRYQSSVVGFCPQWQPCSY